MEFIATILTLLFSVNDGIGEYVIPFLLAVSTAEAAKRVAKRRGINEPLIPWVVSILTGSIFAYLIPPVPAAEVIDAVRIFAQGIMVPLAHTSVLALLGSFEKTKPLARKLAGETKKVDVATIELVRRLNDKGEEEIVVRAEDEITGQDVTIFKRSDATLITQPGKVKKPKE